MLMSISSVGNHPSYAGTLMELPVAKGRHGHRCSCGETAVEPAGNVGTGEETATRAERHVHHGHGKHHGHRGQGFGFGRFGMEHLIHEQIRAARREVASEQIGDAVADLTTKVAELVGAAGQGEGLDAAQENFAAAVQDVVDRFDSGDIGRRRAMAGFRAAFEDLVDTVRTGSAEEKPVAESEVPAEIDAGNISTVSAGEAGEVAGESPDEGGSLVENLGQLFNSFMEGLRSDLATLGGMRSFMSADNRDKIHETFVDLYRELAGLDAGEAGVVADKAVDQLA